MAKKTTRDVPLPSSDGLFGGPGNPKKTISKTRRGINRTKVKTKVKNPNIDNTGYVGQSLDAVTSGSWEGARDQAHEQWVYSNRRLKQIEKKGVGGGVLKSAKEEQKKYRNMMMTAYKKGKRRK